MINRAPLGEVVQCHNWIPEESVRRSEYHNDFLIPFGGRYIAGVNILDTGSIRASMAVHTGLRNGPLGPEAVLALKRLLPHVRSAYRARILLGQERVRSAALDQLDDGIAVVTHHGEVVYANAAARPWIDRNKLRFSPGGPHKSGQQNQVLAMLEHVGAGTGDEVLRLDAEGGHPALLVTATRLPPNVTHGVALTSHGRPLVLLKVQVVGVAALACVNLLERRFALTPAEAEVARLAVAGETTASIAIRRNVSSATVRMQIRRILEKAGVPSLRVLAAVAAGIDTERQCQPAAFAGPGRLSRQRGAAVQAARPEVPTAGAK